VARRTSVGDDGLEALSDDPLEVVGYVCTRSGGVPPAVVRDGLLTFRLDSHRTEIVATRDGIVWIDDSKATNPHAASASLRAHPSIVWIAGGLLKGVDVDELVRRHAEQLSAVVLIGGGLLAAALVRAYWPRVLRWWAEAKGGGAILGRPQSINLAEGEQAA